MKYVLSLIFCMLIGSGLFANPMVTSTVEISELHFDSSGKWVLELVYYQYNPPNIPIDSIFLLSTKDSVKLQGFILEGNIGVIVLRNDSLDSDFEINHYGDKLIVRFYIMGTGFEDILVFGNYDGAVINYPRSGQSICKFSYHFMKDSSPTIGELNDTTGIYGTLSGIVYDISLNPVSVSKFGFDNQFETSESGNYQTRVYSKPFEFNRVYYFYNSASYPHSISVMPIDPISFVMEPDSIVVRDIYLQDTLPVYINNIVKNDFPLKLFPNPVSKSGKLYYEIELPLKTTNCRLELITIDGKVLLAKKVTEQEGELLLFDNRGIVFVNLWMDNELLISSRVIVLNE
jgi:hypothetical protein